MKILFLTQVLPYPLSGGAKIRAYYMLRQLAQRHAVALVSFVRDDDRPADIAHLAQFCTAVHPVPISRSTGQDVGAAVESLLTNQPIVIIRDRIPAMRQLLTRLAAEERFDVVHADQTAMAQYALFFQQQSPTTRTLLDQHNALFKLVARQAEQERTAVKRLVWRREAKLLRRYETNLVRQFDHLLTVTETDRQRLLALLPPTEQQTAAPRMTAVPICVDPESQPLLPWDNPGPQILHLGTMFWPPNIEGVLWFAEAVFPLILAQIPEARFVIAGKNPPASVTALAAPGSPLHGRVAVTGFVADPQPLLSGSAAFIVPLRAGGGMRVKIVDGWQWGVPIVSTSIGAEGIEVRPGENILLADTAELFAAAVVNLLKSDELGRRLRDNGRAWVETYYNWRTIYPQVDHVYQQLTKE